MRGGMKSRIRGTGDVPLCHNEMSNYSSVNSSKQQHRKKKLRKIINVNDNTFPEAANGVLQPMRIKLLEKLKIRLNVDISLCNGHRKCIISIASDDTLRFQETKLLCFNIQVWKRKRYNSFLKWCHETLIYIIITRDRQLKSIFFYSLLNF